MKCAKCGGLKFTFPDLPGPLIACTACTKKDSKGDILKILKALLLDPDSLAAQLDARDVLRKAEAKESKA